MRDMGISLVLLGVASTCSATGSSSVSTPVPMHIWDEFSHPGAPAPSVERISDPAYRAFIAATLDKIGSSPDIRTDSKTNGLQFVRIALASPGNSVPAEPSVAAALPGGCRIRSPWLDVSVAADGSALQGTVYWNERQIVRDRALLDGMKPPPGRATAFSRDEYFDYAQLYADALTQGTELPEGAIPADLLWLFRHSPQSTRGPFATMADGAIRQISQDSAKFYSNLVAVLLERCRQKPGKTTEVHSIKDLGGALEFERDRIT